VISRVIAEEQSIESVLADLEGSEEDEDEEKGPEPRELSAEEEEIKRLETRVERLEAHAADLEETVEERDARIEELEGDLTDARREERREARERREVARLQRENRRLERERDAESEDVSALEDKIERLKELWRLDHSNFADVAEKKAGLLPVKPIEKFTLEAIDEANKRFGLAPEDVILLRDATGAGREAAKRLAEIDPRLVLANGGLSRAADEELFERAIPVGPAEDVTVQEVDELAVAREREVESAVESWEERASERRQHRQETMVDRLISEHRADRGEG
jgi:predicted RNase H-like nuclease (RuvC/YqgF family)